MNGAIGISFHVFIRKDRTMNFDYFAPDCDVRRRIQMAFTPHFHAPSKSIHRRKQMRQKVLIDTERGKRTERRAERGAAAGGRPAERHSPWTQPTSRLALELIYHPRNIYLLRERMTFRLSLPLIFARRRQSARKWTLETVSRRSFSPFFLVHFFVRESLGPYAGATRRLWKSLSAMSLVRCAMGKSIRSASEPQEF